MKLFGQQLFTRKRDGKLYDFAQHGILTGGGQTTIGDATQLFTVNSTNATWTGQPSVTINQPVPSKKNPEKTVEKQISPKELFQLKSLNVENLAIPASKEYLDREIATLRKKADLLPVKRDKKGEQQGYGASKYGALEIESMIVRLENRRKYPDVQHLFDQWPYTNNTNIQGVLKEHDHLRAKLAEEFIPDFPGEAIDAMDEYTKAVQQLCGAKPVFYIIADKKDFGEIGKRRDPVLLAQSPFGFFWQILGAWDEEMILLDEL